MFLDEDGFGNIRRFYILAGEKKYVDNTAGTVNYGNGILSLNPQTHSHVSLAHLHGHGLHLARSNGTISKKK